jgi:hypothetical protein
MSIILTILAIAFLTFVLNILIIQSNNFIFMVFRKPMVWIVFMGVLSFLYFFIGSRFDNSFNIIWWSALLAFIVNIPPKAKKGETIDQKGKNKIVDEMYGEMGIKNGRLKYRIGLAAYLIGGILGWVIFYSQIVTMS